MDFHLSEAEGWNKVFTLCPLLKRRRKSNNLIDGEPLGLHTSEFGHTDTSVPPDASKVEEEVEPRAGSSFGGASHPRMGCLHKFLHILKETM